MNTCSVFLCSIHQRINSVIWRQVYLFPSPPRWTHWKAKLWCHSLHMWIYIMLSILIYIISSILICQQMGANKLFVNMRRDVRALTTFLKIRQKLPIQSGTGEEKFSEVSDENEHDGWFSEVYNENGHGGWLVEPNYSIMGVDGWAGWKTEATAYLEFTKMGHENKIWRHKTRKRCLGGFWDTEVAIAAYWASGRTQIRFAWRTQLVGWSRTSKESFGKISMGDGRMFFKPFSVYHIMRSSPPSNVFVILTPGLLLPKHAYTGQSPPSNVTESTFHLQCVSWGKLWGGGVLSREEKGEGDMFGELDTYIHTFYF